MEICPEKKTNRKDAWELVAGWMSVPDFLACFCSETAGPGWQEREEERKRKGGEEKEERKGEKKTDQDLKSFLNAKKHKLAL